MNSSFLKMINNDSNVLAIVINREFIIAEINNASAEFLGLTTKELIGQKLSGKLLTLYNIEGKAFPFTRWPWVELINDKIFVSNLVIGIKTKKNNICTWFSIFIDPYYSEKDEVEYILLKLYNINSHKFIFNSIINSDNKFFILFENSPMPMAVRLDNHNIWPNEAYCKMLGYSKNEILKFNWQDITKPEDVELAEAAQKRIFEELSQKEEYTKSYVHKDGTFVTCKVTLVSHVIINQLNKSKLIIILAYLINITNEVEKQKRIIENELLVRKLGDISEDAIIITDENLKIKFINKFFNKINWNDNDISELLLLLLSKTKTKNIENDSIYIMKTRGGRIRYIKWNVEYLVNERGYFFHGRDLTEKIIQLRKNKEIRQRDELKIRKKIISVLEKQRENFSCEIHDNVLQLFFFSKLLLEKNLDNPQKSDLVRIHELINQINFELREFTHQLSSPIKSNMNLVEDLNYLIDNVSINSNIKFHRDFKDDLKIKDDFIRINIYRILQEGIINILKHAKAKSVTISVYKKRNNLVIDLIDDGVGFSGKENLKGIGLMNMRARVKAINGSIKIISSSLDGTKIQLKLLQNSLICR